MTSRSKKGLVIAWLLVVPASFVVSLAITAIGQRLGWIENGEFGLIAAIGLLIQTTATMVAVLLGVTVYLVSRRSRP